MGFLTGEETARGCSRAGPYHCRRADKRQESSAPSLTRLLQSSDGRQTSCCKILESSSRFFRSLMKRRRLPSEVDASTAARYSSRHLSGNESRAACRSRRVQARRLGCFARSEGWLADEEEARPEADVELWEEEVEDVGGLDETAGTEVERRGGAGGGGKEDGRVKGMDEGILEMSNFTGSRALRGVGKK